MRSLLFNHIHNARESIRSNRLRSFLTMVGIMIGVASVTAILALGAGARSIVRDQVDALGGTLAVVRPGAPKNQTVTNLTELASANQHYATSSLTMADYHAIAETEHVKAAAPMMILPGAPQQNDKSTTPSSILATTPAFEPINSVAVREGQFLDDNLSQDTVVIGLQLAIDALGTEHAIGKTLTLKGKPFTVVGVLERVNQPVSFNGVDLDTTAIIPLESGRMLNQGSLSLQQIDLQSESVAHLSGVITAINQRLLKNHFNQVDFSVLSGAAIAQPTSQLFNAISGASIAVAVISLIVGGVGIMNIMLVSVAERTRELGIRKAVGASNGTIILQFLIESLALSIGGGILGYTLGYGAAFALSSLLAFTPVITWQIAVTALAVSVTVGVLFGIYPAVRAARKDPIQALRQYE